MNLDSLWKIDALLPIIALFREGSLARGRNVGRLGNHKGSIFCVKEMMLSNVPNMRHLKYKELAERRICYCKSRRSLEGFGL